MTKERDQLAEQVGAVVRARRKALGLSQEVLADRISVSTVTLSNIERGENVPTLGVYLRLHHELGLDINQLVGVPVEARRVGRDRLKLEAEALELIRGVEQRDLGLLIALAREMMGKKR